MKKLGLVLLIFLNVYVTASDYTKIPVGIGSLVLGCYLARNTYEHNTLVPKAEIKRQELERNLDEAVEKSQEAYESTTRTVLTDYSQWYFRTYHELPYTELALFANEEKISNFFKTNVQYHDKGTRPVVGASTYAKIILDAARQKATSQNYFIPGTFIIFGLWMNALSLAFG